MLTDWAQSKMIAKVMSYAPSIEHFASARAKQNIPRGCRKGVPGRMSPQASLGSDSSPFEP